MVELIIVTVLFLVLIPSSLGIYIGARKITGQSYLQHQAAVTLGETSDIIRYMQNLNYDSLARGEFFLIRNPGNRSWLVKSDLADMDAFERRVNVDYALRNKNDNELFLDEIVITENEQDLIGLMNQNPPLTSAEVKDALLAVSPISTTVMVEAIDRTPPLNSSDMKEVLLASSPLETYALQSLIFRTPPLMTSSDMKDVLLASSPLLTSTLQLIIDMTPPLYPGDLAIVMAAQAGPVQEYGDIYLDVDTKKIDMSVLWAPEYIPLDLVTHELYITNWEKLFTY